MVSCANGKERIFTASTPADIVIRSFLGIPQPDSIDFIRWKLVLTDNNYKLHCNYGISKPNTNGFINGGKTIELSGVVAIEKNYYQLKNGSTVLNIIELNDNLLHLLSTDKSLLVGNGGWSYTLNNIKPSIADEINIQAKHSLLQDSIVFDGRTPCKVPGVVPAGTECYKLKWRIILYADKQKNGTGSYKILGTAWRKENGQTGSWTVITGKNGRIIYQLKDNKETVVLHLLKADENILLFIDANGNLLTGDEDFSYTLNRK
jgi:hypothetical protein